MNRIYKLKFNTREEAINELINKGIIIEDLDKFGLPIHSIIIVKEDEKFFCIDIMSEKEYDFSNNEVFPNEILHSFSGWDN